MCLMILACWSRRCAVPYTTHVNRSSIRFASNYKLYMYFIHASCLPFAMLSSQTLWVKCCCRYNTFLCSAIVFVFIVIIFLCLFICCCCFSSVVVFNSTRSLFGRISWPHCLYFTFNAIWRDFIWLVLFVV